jgi:hypothetical protein
MIYIVYVIIGTVVFLVLRKIIGRLFPNLKTAKDVISGFLAVCLAPIIAKVIFILFFNLIMYEYHPNRKFETNSWQENLQDRHQMSEDLIERKILINKSKNQIATELGKPNGDIRIETDTLSNWRYNMGSRGWGFGLKYYYLNIEFENNKTIQVRREEIID